MVSLTWWRARPWFVPAVVSVVLLIACGDKVVDQPAATGTDGGAAFSAAPPGGQRLGVYANPRLKPTPQQADYVDAVNLVRGLGAKTGVQASSWSELETADGRRKAMESLRYQADGLGFQMLLSLKIIDTTNLTLPADLKGRSFDDPAMIRRFKSLVDELKPQLPPRLAFLAIGNEVDVYLGMHPDQWSTYQRFYQDAVAYVHKVLPGVKVGVTTTFDGANGPHAQRVRALNKVSEVMILTYYPLTGDFSPRPADTARRDVAAMVNLAGGRPVVLQEVGYPSADLLGSGQKAQADFVREVLAAWRKQGSRIPALNWFALHDFDEALCDELGAYYSLADSARFKAFLCSLGLREVDGTAKLSWQAFVQAATST